MVIDTAVRGDKTIMEQRISFKIEDGGEVG
jgi:hypothetical protein